MKKVSVFQLPVELKLAEKKVIKLEYITLIYLTTVVFVMYLVMGNSQAMKTAWLEDALGMIPALSYLIAVRHYKKAPNKEFPYGYQRNFSIAFLGGSIALLGMGLFLITDSAISLVKSERPTIGSIYLFGHQLWMGWLMIGALVYSSVPAMILGYKKLPLAKKLHNKILFTDADAQKADYMTGFAAMAGIVGVGLGWWWADSVAAILISTSVIKDGATNVRNAVYDLMDRHPHEVDGNERDSLIEELSNYAASFEWVKDVSVRFRECGQVYVGEIYVVAHNDQINPEKTEEMVREIEKLNWKIVDITVMVVNELPSELETKEE